MVHTIREYRSLKSGISGHDAFFSKGKIKARLFKCATGRDIPLMSPNVITVKENLPFFLFMSITTTYYTIP